MRDYLGHLTNRVLRGTNVHPRVPSLFEPPALTAAARDTFVPARAREHEFARDMDVHRIKEQPRAVRSERPVEEARRIRRVEPAEQAPLLPTRTAPAQPIEQKVPEVRHETVLERRPAIVRPVPAPESGPAAAPRGVPERAPVFAPAQREQAVRPLAPMEKPRRESEVRARTRAIDGAEARKTALPRDPIPVRPSAVIPPRQTRLLQDPLGAPEPAPSVSVVIGRVTVQAVMPATPVARGASGPPSPKLSLDQYLERRGGRR